MLTYGFRLISPSGSPTYRTRLTPPALKKPHREIPMRIPLASAFVILALGAVQAQEPAPVPAVERSAFDFTHCWGGCRAGCNSERRASYPESIACYARPGESPAYVGYY